MRLFSDKPYTPLSFITTMAAIAMASIFLFFSAIQLGTIIAAAPIGNYLSPGFPERAEAENTLAAMTMLVCAGILIYSIFRPAAGGLILCIYSVFFGFVFNALHFCTALYPSREARFFPSWSVVTILLVLLSVLFILRSRKTSRADAAPTA